LEAVSEGGQSLATGNGIVSAHVADGVAIVEVGSGSYEFTVTDLP
jgi:hypothetical protein